MKKVIISLLLVGVIVGGYLGYKEASKILPFYSQLKQDHAGMEVNLQDTAQKKAHYVGAAKCLECHKENHTAWAHSQHPKMIQDLVKDPSVVVADFSKLPADADFKLEDAVYTVGGKFSSVL